MDSFVTYASDGISSARVMPSSVWRSPVSGLPNRRMGSATQRELVGDRLQPASAVGQECQQTTCHPAPS
jgi:hypothetical protein